MTVIAVSVVVVNGHGGDGGVDGAAPLLSPLLIFPLTTCQQEVVNTVRGMKTTGQIRVMVATRPTVTRVAVMGTPGWTRRTSPF